MADIIALRRDTAANWISNNPVLSDGEAVFDTTNKIFKIGDGSTTYSSLPIAGAAGQSFPIVVIIDITAGDGDYSIDPDSVFKYNIIDINAVELDIGTATITLKINATPITGISVAATTTRSTVPDVATAANAVVIDDDLKVNVASSASSPKVLKLRLNCTKVL